MKNILALLADWANGIFAILIAAFLFGIEPEWWYFLVGILFAMSPDIDALPELLQRGKVSASAEYQRDHRTFLHFPVISLPLALLLAWYFGFWGVVWLIAVVLHLINDLYGTGWGIALLYPFSTKRYKFDPTLFKHKANTFTSYDEKTLAQEIIENGNDNWLEDTYLTLNWISITEYSLFTFACILLILSLLY